jgi:hypothetical protein
LSWYDYLILNFNDLVCKNIASIVQGKQSPSIAANEEGIKEVKKRRV